MQQFEESNLRSDFLLSQEGGNKNLNQEVEEPKKSHLGKGKSKCPKTRPNQKILKFRNYLNGIWTKDEHDMLLFALEIFGNQWRAIQIFLGTRSSGQIRSHVQKHFQAIRRETIKDLQENSKKHQGPFLITKQYRNYPFRVALTEEEIRRVKEIKKLYFSSKAEKKENSKAGEGDEHIHKEDFDLPPLGNIPNEDNMAEYMNEIKCLEFPLSPRNHFHELLIDNEVQMESSLSKLNFYQPDQWFPITQGITVEKEYPSENQIGYQTATSQENCLL